MTGLHCLQLRNNKAIKLIISFVLLVITQGYAQNGDPVKGKELFAANCTACHTLNVKLIGPPLKGVADRRSEDYIFNMVTNSTEWVQTNPDAKKLFEEFNKVPMTPFPHFTKEDVKNIIAYTTVGDEGIADAEPRNNDLAKAHNSSEELQIYHKTESVNSNWWWQPIFVLMLAVLLVFLLKKEQIVLGIMTAIVLALSTAYFLFAWLMQIGVDSGYKPVQPIEFSHKVHAGDNGIDCQYCHSSAKHSKTSGIPSADVCMNCHKFITQYNGELYDDHDKAFFDKEIAKVHEAVGWSPKDFAYTGKQKPIEWVRVHNLPDFAYYNHSQHVTVAGLECQTCHGPVESMHRLEQFSNLTMGWCIDCHKQTKVKMDENGYYVGTYEDFAKGHKGVTVADMGGRECGKCHY